VGENIQKKKKVLIVTFPQGGPFVWAQNLAKHLEKNGYETKISTGRKNYFFDQFRRHDIVHSCVALPFSFGRKFILTIHGNFKEENIRSKLFFPLAIAAANTVTVPSVFLKKSLNLGTATVIPNGIKLPMETKRSCTLIGSEPVLGILTSFHFRQKADGLIPLAKIIEAISPEIKLVIGGAGEFFEEYKKIILALHPNTEFLGHCKREDLFSKIDIFTYYSLLDNQPLVILEAMAFGLPLMTNLVGSVEEMLTGKMASYIARTDDEYKRTLRTLLESQTTREENSQEAKKIAQEFSWTRIIKEYIEIYEK
jgi:glycosyltransferase involved in cell wall biosynthesis